MMIFMPITLRFNILSFPEEQKTVFRFLFSLRFLRLCRWVAIFFYIYIYPLHINIYVCIYGTLDLLRMYNFVILQFHLTYIMKISG